MNGSQEEVNAMSRMMTALVFTLCAAASAGAENLVQNPGFDGNTTGWVVYSDPNVLAEYSAEDASGDPSSGSASVTNYHPSGGTAVDGFSQCVPVVENVEYRFAAQVKIAAGQGSTGDGGITVYWYDSPACDTYISGLSVASDVTGNWTPVSDFQIAPAGAESAKVFVKVFKLDAGGSLNALVDDVVVEPVLFQDGFETGNTNSWSVVFP